MSRGARHKTQARARAPRAFAWRRVHPMNWVFLFLWVLALLGILVGLGAILASSAAANPSPHTAQGRKEILDTLSLYLARQRLVSGRFVQTNPNGEILAGRFFLARPGRMRFAYTVPRDMLIVADGERVHIRLNKNLPPEAYPLELSPLALFLRYDMDFHASRAVVGLEETRGQMAVRLRDPAQALPGELVMQFAWPQVALLGWIVRDTEGKEIAIRLQELRQEVTLDSRLFQLTP